MKYDAHEIYPGLWQGGWPQPGRWLANQGVSTLVLCAMEYQPEAQCQNQPPTSIETYPNILNLNLTPSAKGGGCLR